METFRSKPLGIKAYGSIGHLPGSRRGPGDHGCHAGQGRIATGRARDRHDRIIVEQKLDGSCVAVAKHDGAIIPLQRKGYTALSSPYEQHRMFAAWVFENAERFDAVLREGERIVGEWLAQAHGTIYRLPHEPFVAFDIMRGPERELRDEFRARVGGKFELPQPISDGPPLTIEEALAALDPAAHGAVDEIEGYVWRVERHGAVDFLAKFVRHEKVDGCYLPEVSGRPAIWNWRNDL